MLATWRIQAGMQREWRSFGGSTGYVVRALENAVLRHQVPDAQDSQHASGRARHHRERASCGDFALVPFASVTGTIVDATTGKPLAGLTVRNAKATGASSFAAMISGNGQKTAASGRFELTSQPLGDGRLMVFDGQAPMMPAAGGSTRFTLTAGQRSTGDTATITSHAPAR